jgi:hypothetical protein
MLATATLSLAVTIQQTPGYIVSDMGGEKVMMSIENGNYYNLGEIGGIIWDQMEKPIKISKLTVNLSNEYDIEKEECEKQVLSFLESLRKENLIQIHSH